MGLLGVSKSKTPFEFLPSSVLSCITYFLSYKKEDGPRTSSSPSLRFRLETRRIRFAKRFWRSDQAELPGFPSTEEQAYKPFRTFILQTRSDYRR